MSDQQSEKKEVKRRDVFTVIEVEGKKAYWQRLGSAFVNKDGSEKIILNGLPVNGELVIRDLKPEDPSAPAEEQK